MTVTSILTQISHNIQKINEEILWKEVNGKNRNSPKKTMSHKQPKMDSYRLSKLVLKLTTINIFQKLEKELDIKRQCQDGKDSQISFHFHYFIFIAQSIISATLSIAKRNRH